jgi:two-component system sensor histidine kinase DctS
MEDSALVGLRARDPEGRLLYVNKTLCEMVGYNREELIGLKPPLPFWPADAIDDMMARNMRTLSGETPVSGFETRWQHKNGQVLDVMIFEARLVNSNGEPIGWMGSIVDISERKRLEEKDRKQVEALAQHARLNDMGLLSAELAHELNQPLTTIVSYSAGLGIALRKLEPVDGDLLFAVDEVHKYAKKAGDIVHWIRRQTTRSEPERRQWDVNAIVTDVVTLRQRHLNKGHVQLLLELEPEACICQVDRIAIEQVISNLLRNAADALMERNGNRRLAVRTQLLSDSFEGKQRIALSVSDNGPGLKGRTLDTLCATFYSTKSEGMGLGLGICRAIIESHGGAMSASEAPGGGAMFAFTLPLSDTSPLAD